MHNLLFIEEYYKKFIKNLYEQIPEGIYIVDLDLLHRLNLLHFLPGALPDTQLTRYFQIFESAEKITLINDEFVIWIIPDHMNQTSITYALIAFNHADKGLELEAAFIASGIYNSSRLVLKVLEKFLIDIQENENVLSKLTSTA